MSKPKTKLGNSHFRCSQCEKPLKEHRKCQRCDRFVWCTAISRDEKPLFVHYRCPLEAA